MPVPLARLLCEPQPLLSPAPWQRAVAAEEWAQHNVMARKALPSLAGRLARLSSLFLSLAVLCEFISMRMT